VTCRHCGTEIADKAFICYRCGTATSEAQHPPYAAPARRSRSMVVMALALLALLVLVVLFLLHSHSL
jgi:type VI protein secretion system component VasF